MNASAIQSLEISILPAGAIPDIGGMGAFFKGTFSEKSALCLLAPPKEMSFLTNYHGNIFSILRALV